MKYQIFVFIFIISIISMIPSTLANTSNVIVENKSGSYLYIVTKEEDSFKWTIGYKNKKAVVYENKQNSKELDSFRQSVNEIDLLKTKGILFILYVIIILITLLIVKKKKKQIPSIPKALIVILIAYTLSISFQIFIDLHSTFKDANYYYQVLMYT